MQSEYFWIPSISFIYKKTATNTPLFDHEWCANSNAVLEASAALHYVFHCHPSQGHHQNELAALGLLEYSGGYVKIVATVTRVIN